MTIMAARPPHFQSGLTIMTMILMMQIIIMMMMIVLILSITSSFRDNIVRPGLKCRGCVVMIVTIGMHSDDCHQDVVTETADDAEDAW